MQTANTGGPSIMVSECKHNKLKAKFLKEESDIWKLYN